MKIYITGILGFLGSHLADALNKQGHIVYGNDNLLTGCLNNMHERQDKDYISLRDCCDPKFLREKLNPAIDPPGKPFDVLIHCAATAHEGLSNFSPAFITRNIYEASVTTFSAAIATGVKRIVFMSSMARYGRGITLEFKRDDPPQDIFAKKSYLPPFHEGYPTAPIDPYGIAKAAAEQTLKALCKLHGTEYVIAVPHNIIGIRQKYDDPYRNVASIMINRALQGKSILVYGDGQQKRCFSPIKDCLDSLVKMIDAPISGETINIGPDSGEITVLELARIIQRLCTKYAPEVPIEHVAERPNEVKEAYCSSEKARRLLDFKPQQSIEDCLSEMVDHIHKFGTKDFKYDFPIEIAKGCPEVWTRKLI